jgi:hypothetical protein
MAQRDRRVPVDGYRVVTGVTRATYGVPSAPITCSTNSMISSGSTRSLRGRAVRATTVRAMPVSRTDGAQLARPRDSWLRCCCQSHRRHNCIRKP